MTLIVDNATFAVLASRYTAGENIHKLAKEYGIGIKAIWSRMTRKGIIKHIVFKKLNNDEVDDMISLYNSGVRNRDICKKYSISQARLGHILTRKGIMRCGWAKRRGQCHVCHIKLDNDNHDPAFKLTGNYTCRVCARFKRMTKRRKVKLRILRHYGTKCACCGDENVEFLTIDHINNDGSIRRKEHKSKTGMNFNLYRWLIRNNFPQGDFRTLCFNCNCARGAYGYCPHEKNRILPELKTSIN